MHRFSALMISLTIGVATATAGQIQIGGLNGLTSSYISSGCSTNVAGQTCAAGGTSGSVVESNYDSRLFQNAQPAAVPYPTYNQSAAATGSLTGTGTYDDGVTFSMINDGTGGLGSNNFWQLGSANATITIPIGILDVTSVWTMLNNIWGPQGATDTVVTFNFGSSNANTTTSSVVIDLVNAGNSSTPSGQIGAAIDCTTTSTTACLAMSVGSLAGQTTNIGGTGVTVDTDNVVSIAYNSVAAGKYLGTAGFLNLDDQGFQFSSAYASDYLVSIQVKELNGTGSASQTALSAITVESPIPEPSTVVLLIAGIGAIGASRLRKLRRS